MKITFTDFKENTISAIVIQDFIVSSTTAFFCYNETDRTDTYLVKISDVLDITFVDDTSKTTLAKYIKLVSEIEKLHNEAKEEAKKGNVSGDVAVSIHDLYQLIKNDLE